MRGEAHVADRGFQMTGTPRRRSPWTGRHLLLALLLTGVLLWPTLPAAAHPSLEHHCPVGAVCLFEAADFLHEMHWWFGDDGSYYWETYELSTDGHGHRVNDTSSSLDNDGQQCGTRHFVNSDYGGDHFWVPLGGAVSNLAAVGNGFHNRLSSHDWCGDRGHH